jgi:putative addiction module component (TIGR02574 family)
MSILLEQALKLPPPERRQLADDIYESLESADDRFSLTEEQKAELSRRLEDYRKNPDGIFRGKRYATRLSPGNEIRS